VGHVIRARLSAALLSAALLFAALALPAAAWATGVADFPPQPPASHVLDEADLLSRAAGTELDRRLEEFGGDRIDARLVTLRRLDYGLSLDVLGEQLVERWSADEADRSLLILLIESQNNSAAVVASSDLDGQLPSELLSSTAISTMGLPLREGARYRQASLDAIARLRTVLEQGDDPGEPTSAELERPASNVPTREETASSNAFTWVVVLLVVGSVVPMVTWWVFSR